MSSVGIEAEGRSPREMSVRLRSISRGGATEGAEKKECTVETECSQESMPVKMLKAERTGVYLPLKTHHLISLR